MHLVYTEVLVQKWFMMSFWPLLSTLLLSQFNLRHLQFWKALLSQNPHIFYIFLSVIMFKTLKFSVLLKSSQFICPCKLLFFSSILHLYCVCHFFLEEPVQSKFPRNWRFVYVGLRMRIIVNVSENYLALVLHE